MNSTSTDLVPVFVVHKDEDDPEDVANLALPEYFIAREKLPDTTDQVIIWFKHYKEDEQFMLAWKEDDNWEYTFCHLTDRSRVPKKLQAVMDLLQTSAEIEKLRDELDKDLDDYV